MEVAEPVPGLDASVACAIREGNAGIGSGFQQYHYLQQMESTLSSHNATGLSNSMPPKSVSLAAIVAQQIVELCGAA